MEQAALRPAEKSREVKSKLDARGFDGHAERSIWLGGDPKILYNHGAPERCFDFSQLDTQPFLSRSARDPQAQSARDDQRSKADHENAGDQ